MVDRRKALHRRACEWSAAHPEVFLAGQIPYASVVEQMTVRRMPLAVFAPRDPATTAFAEIWAELQTRLRQRGTGPRQRDRWELPLQAIESLIARLERADPEESSGSRQAPSLHADVEGRRDDQDSHSAAEESDSAVRSACATSSCGRAMFTSSMTSTPRVETSSVAATSSSCTSTQASSVLSLRDPQRR